MDVLLTRGLTIPRAWAILDISIAVLNVLSVSRIVRRSMHTDERCLQSLLLKGHREPRPCF